MQKIALYRKYRPDNFQETIGQEHIKTVLENALLSGKVSHAYLFSGPRGTGKTSLARIIAKSLNCKDRKDANPCGKCNICVGINEGRILDLIEIDAASNRGIDEIRDLREKVKFSPTEGEYKVFIIDEVHMLTKEAFNALLKTLEEPPEHAIFILATTEIHKVPATIISRCQRHDFKRIHLNDIVAKLSEIAGKEKIKISDEALETIGETAEGGLRDAISLLDQLSSSGLPDIEEKDVENILGIAPYVAVFDFVKALLLGDSAKAIEVMDKAQNSGVDLIIFTKSAAELTRKILFAKLTGSDSLEGTKEQIEKLTKLSEEVEQDKVVQLSEELMWAQDSFRIGVDPKIILLVLAAKFSQNREVVSVSVPQEVVQTAATSKEGEPAKKTNKNNVPAPIELNGKWKHFMMEIKAKNNTIHAFLRVANPELTDAGLTLTFPYKFHKERLEEPRNKKIVEETLARIYGKQIDIICKMEESGAKNKQIGDVQSAANILGGEVVD